VAGAPLDADPLVPDVPLFVSVAELDLFLLPRRVGLFEFAADFPVFFAVP
jgi:hypothetical protein